MNKDTGESIKYKEADRAARQGDRIRIVDAYNTYGMYANGDEFNVIEKPFSKHFIRIKEVATISTRGNPGGEVDREEYVVLDLVRAKTAH